MKPRAYVETTVISYLAADPSRDIVVAAHQQLTHEWWAKRHRFELMVSQAVVDEVSRGDAAMAARRLALLVNVPVLDLSDTVNELARKLLRSRAVPSKASLDAVHIAVAAVNRVNYLVTWNCTHIANASVRVKIEEACRGSGLSTPTICTPEQLMEP